MKKSWLIACLVNFCIAVMMGILMRMAYLFPMNFNYTFMLHAHSHTVILGWCYLAVFGFIIEHFLSKEESRKPIYNRLFWITEISVLGMMVSFPFQGYAFFSIFFSTLHILCSYYFCYLLFKNHKTLSSIDGMMLKTGLLFMVFSTLGVWCLGPVASSGAKDSAFYNIAIQFFLHFQFNGWFLFAVLGLFLSKIQKIGIVLSKANFKNFYLFFLISIFFTFSLPISWYFSSPVWQALNSLGLVLQLVALFYLIRLILPHLKKIKENLHPITKLLYGVAFNCLFIKIAIQTATILPELAIASHAVRNFTIGYIHLLMLGIVNSSLFAFITQTNHFKSKQNLGKFGILVFISGFIIMEILLFYQGFCAYTEKTQGSSYFTNILISSIIVAIGLFSLLLHVTQAKKN